MNLFGAGFLSRGSILAVGLLILSGCAPPPIPGPVSLKGSSRTLDVRGEYKPIALNQVDGLSIEGGKVVVRGAATTVSLDLPQGTDPTTSIRHWALVTDAELGGHRALTFTHDMTLDDFTVELPPGDAGIHYGVLAGEGGNDLMVLAWGKDSRSYSCFLTIGHLTEGGAGH